jgi:hypothetical protein
MTTPMSPTSITGTATGTRERSAEGREEGTVLALPCRFGIAGAAMIGCVE